MDTFDDLLGKAKNFVDAAGRKTGEAMEIARLKMTRMQVNADIQKTYEKLGAFVYKFHKTGEKNQELIDVCVDEVDALLQQLVEIANRINEIKAALRCPDCGAANDDEAIYCTRCGAKIHREAPVAEEEVVCPMAPIILPIEHQPEVSSEEPLEGEDSVFADDEDPNFPEHE